MIIHYTRIAFRNIVSQPRLTIGSIVGLASGVSAFLFLALVAEHELSYDTIHPYADRTFRVLVSVDHGDGTSIDTKTPDAIAQQMRESLPEIDYALRAGSSEQSILVEAGDKRFYESRILGVDTTFFDVFDFEPIAGDLKQALSRPDAVVLTESAARKYFGDANPIGQSVTFEKIETGSITAVIRDPRNTHFEFDILTPLRPASETTWNQRYWSTYVVLKENVDVAQLQEKLTAFVEKYQIDGPGISPEYRLSLQPIEEVHLDPDGDGGQKMGRLLYVYAFGIAGVLVFIIAGFNYANMATARLMRRLREMGVRRVLGAQRSQIVSQILIETVLLSLAAAALGILLVGTLLPWAGRTIGFDFTLDQLLSIRWVGTVVGCAAGIGLLGGALPAFMFSYLNPTISLRGWTSGTRSSSLPKKAFIAIQLTVSAFFVIVTAVVYWQIQHVRDTRLNRIDGEIVVVANYGMFINDHYEAFKERLLSHQAIRSVTTGSVPGQIDHRMSLEAEDTREGEHVEIATLMAGNDYIETLGLNVVEGLAFSEQTHSHPGVKVIYNETAVRRLNLRGKVGDRIADGHMLLVGVVQDFHMSPLYDNIGPVGIWYYPDIRTNILVRLHPSLIETGVQHLRQTWQEFVPERPVYYEFLDDRLDRAYMSDIRIGQLFGAFAGIAVIIAVFGMYSFARWSGESRKREICIRKACGAGSGSIFTLLVSDVVKLFIVSFAVGAPVAWFVAAFWLQDFAYRSEVPLGLIVAVGLGGLLVSLVSVGYEAVKAASLTPVSGLRTE